MPRISKAVLVYPSALNAAGWLHFFAKQGWNRPFLDILAGALERDVPVESVDLSAEFGYPADQAGRRRFKRLAEQRVAPMVDDRTLVGISCWSSLEYLATVSLARTIRRRAPRAVVVVGGYHATCVPEDFTCHPDLFDHVVVGPGEAAIRSVALGRARSRVIIGRSPPGPPVELLAQRPPSRPCEVYSVFLSRGCPHACAFCVESLMSSRAWRALPPEDAAAMMVRADETGLPQVIEISDACFGASPAWRRAFLALMGRHRFRSKISIDTRVDMIDEDDLLAYERLPVYVNFGLESGSPEMLRIMNKAADPARYLERAAWAIRELTARRIPFSAFVIFNHPGETPETFRETLAFVDSVSTPAIRQTRTFRAHTFFHVPGNSLSAGAEDLARRYGTRLPAKPWWKQNRDHLDAAFDVVASRELSAAFGENPYFWFDEYHERNNPQHSLRVYAFGRET